MKEIETTEIKKIGFQAADGTTFYYKNDDERATAKEQCKKYEESAVGVVLDRIKDVFFGTETKKIRAEETRDGKTEIVEQDFRFCIDEDIGRAFGYYEYTSFIFIPRNKEDVENFKMYCELKGNTYIYGYEDIKIGETHMVMFDEEGECVYVATKEKAAQHLMDMINLTFTKAEVYQHPEQYVKKAYNKYEKE